MFKKILTLLLSNLKLIFVKLFHPKSFSYHPYNNISPLSIIEISQKGSIKLGKKLIVKRNTRIAANRGKISIGQNSGIGSNCYIVSHENITIGKNVFIGPNVVIVDHDHKFDKNGIKRKEFTSKSITIEDGAWIGANSVVLKGVKIGANSIVAAGSVVSKNVPARTIFVQKRKTDFIKIDGAGNEKD